MLYATSTKVRVHLFLYLKIYVLRMEHTALQIFFGGSIAYRGGSENNTLLFPAPCVHTNRDGGCFVVVYIVGPEALLLLKNKNLTFIHPGVNLHPLSSASHSYTTVAPQLCSFFLKDFDSFSACPQGTTIKA